MTFNYFELFLTDAVLTTNVSEPLPEMYPDFVAVALAVYVPVGADFEIEYVKVNCPLAPVVPVPCATLPFEAVTFNVTDAPLTGVELLVTPTVKVSVEPCVNVPADVTETDSDGVIVTGIETELVRVPSVPDIVIVVDAVGVKLRVVVTLPEAGTTTEVGLIEPDEGVSVTVPV